MKNALKLAVAMAAMSLCSCMNMPTPTSQITATHVSDVLYSKPEAEEPKVELDSLNRREGTLVVAQDQRTKTSEMQAFWYGYGQGDGIEAAELAHVRGQIEAVRRVLESKGVAHDKPDPADPAIVTKAYEKALRLARGYKAAGMTYAQSAAVIGANADAEGAGEDVKREALRLFEQVARDADLWVDELGVTTTDPGD